MTTLEQFIPEVQENIGGNTTLKARTAIVRGINAALITVSILYEPPEAHIQWDVVTRTTHKWIDISDPLYALPRLLRIDYILNNTRSCTVYPLSLQDLNSLYLPEGGSPNWVVFYSLYGNILHYRRQPTELEGLRVYYLQYPERVSDDEDILPYPMYEDFILDMASAYSFAFLEEGESEQLWERLASSLHIPFSTLTTMKRIIGELPGGNNIQGALPESIS